MSRSDSALEEGETGDYVDPGSLAEALGPECVSIHIPISADGSLFRHPPTRRRRSGEALGS